MAMKTSELLVNLKPIKSWKDALEILEMSKDSSVYACMEDSHISDSDIANKMPKYYPQ